ncbi:MAG: hypothetical protein Fur0028_03190 [Bacteroidales bacterium]
MESKNRLVVIFLAFSLLFSCSRKQKEIPSEIIQQDSLVNIIVDIHLADAILLNPLTQSKISDISSNRLYKTVLDKYGISRERFNKSIDFYAETPAVLDSIYDKVIEQLSLIESKGYNDSLQRK